MSEVEVGSADEWCKDFEYPVNLCHRTGYEHIVKGAISKAAR
jgi:hypothetical protein